MTRLIDADKLYPDCLTKNGRLAISQNQIANALTVEERSQGEWIAREDMDYLDQNKVYHNHFMCEKCGLVHDFIDGHTSQYNFCPNCGADMRGE